MATTIIKGSSNDNQAEVDSTGHLFVTDAAGGPPGGPPPASILEVGGLSPTNTLVPLMFDSAGRLLVDAEVVMPSTVTVVQPTGSLLHATIDASALPTGAATSANQSTEITHLTSIDTKTPTLGQKTMAGSSPVVIASDQSPVPISGSITATNASIGLIGSPAPTSATEIGAVDSSGNLQYLTVDPAGKLLVDISGTSTVTGTVNANIEGLTSFQTSQYIIGTSAVQLTPTPLTNRSSMSIKVTTTSSLDIVYVGNSNAVTTTTGYALFSGDSIQLDLTPAQVIWAIGTSAGQIAYVMEIGD